MAEWLIRSVTLLLNLPPGFNLPTQSNSLSGSNISRREDIQRYEFRRTSGRFNQLVRVLISRKKIIETIPSTFARFTKRNEIPWQRDLHGIAARVHGPCRTIVISHGHPEASFDANLVCPFVNYHTDRSKSIVHDRDPSAASAVVHYGMSP